MAKAIIGNQAAVTVPRQDRDSVRRFYCDVLGGKIVKEDADKDILRLQDEFYIAFRYADVPDESEFLRSSRSIWLQIQSDDVEEMTRKVLAFGVRKLDMPGSHLYFQAPGGQCFQLIAVDEDRSYYKGTGGGPNAAKEKVAEALKDEAINKRASSYQRSCNQDRNVSGPPFCRAANIEG
jgi:catechol 2,3-dioxygenase-like lactoylglutathione lyase family enzyme